MNNYRPRFKPEVYLYFLNTAEYLFEMYKFPESHNIRYILNLKTLTWPDESTIEHQFMSFDSFEECFDKAILATNF
jgi:hypothetical protein